MKAKKTCSIKGCSGKHKGHGWCGKHYQRWKQHGDPLYTPPRMSQQQCSVEGCKKKAKSRGWCDTHYKRWERFGDPLVVHTWGELSNPQPKSVVGSIEYKECWRCGRMLPAPEFYDYMTGRQCRRCLSEKGVERTRIRLATDPGARERQRASVRKWVGVPANRAKARAAQRRYGRKHPRKNGLDRMLASNLSEVQERHLRWQAGLKGFGKCSTRRRNPGNVRLDGSPEAGVYAERVAVLKDGYFVIRKVVGTKGCRRCAESPKIGQLYLNYDQAWELLGSGERQWVNCPTCSGLGEVPDYGYDQYSRCPPAYAKFVYGCPKKLHGADQIGSDPGRCSGCIEDETPVNLLVDGRAS